MKMDIVGSLCRLIISIINEAIDKEDDGEIERSNWFEQARVHLS